MKPSWEGPERICRSPFIIVREVDETRRRFFRTFGFYVKVDSSVFHISKVVVELYYVMIKVNKNRKQQINIRHEYIYTKFNQ